jgi:hypothetical protein
MRNNLVGIINESTNTNSSIDEYDYVHKCGINNCPDTILPPTHSTPTVSSTFALCYSIIALVILAMLITVLFLDHIRDEDESGANAVSNSICNFFINNYIYPMSIIFRIRLS